MTKSTVELDSISAVFQKLVKMTLLKQKRLFVEKIVPRQELFSRNYCKYRAFYKFISLNVDNWVVSTI